MPSMMSRFFSFWTKKELEPETERNSKVTDSCDNRSAGSERQSPKPYPPQADAQRNLSETAHDGDSSPTYRLKRTVKHPDGCVSLYKRFNLQYVLRSIETVDCYVKVRVT